MTQSDIDNILKWQRIFADNSDMNDTERGIIKFSRMVFPEFIKPEYGIAPVHQHIYQDILNLYDPALRFLPERQEQIISFRGSSKSTTVLGIFACYIVCVNGHEIILPNGVKVWIKEDVICISSETGTFAENWTVRLRAALSSKKFLNYVYGNMKRVKLQDEDGKWQLGNFSVKKENLPEPYKGKNCAVIARGTGQQIRGINLNGRITLWLVDDIYSKNNIKTPESRQNIRYWFNAEAKNSIDLNEGKIVSIGTVVHDDTVIVDNKNSISWKTIEYPIMDFDKFQEALKYCKVDMSARTCQIPSVQECIELEEKGFNTNWPLKFPLELLFMKYAEAVQGHEGMTITMFYQEYFHITLAEEDKTIRQSHMIERDFDLILHKVNNIEYSFVKIGDEYRHVNTMIGLDVAGGRRETNDPSGLVFIGMDYYARVYVFSSASLRGGLVDEFNTPELQKQYYGKLCTNYADIHKVGSLDEMFRWMGDHKSELLIEIQSTIGHEAVRQTYSKMTMYGKRRIVIELPATTNKEERILTTLAPYYQSFSVFHRPGQERLKKQIEFIGKLVNDDEADILAACISKIRKPTRIVEFKEKAENEVRDFQNTPYKFPFASSNRASVSEINDWKTR